MEMDRKIPRQIRGIGCLSNFRGNKFNNGISSNKFDKHPIKRKHKRIFRKLVIVAKFLKTMNYEEVKYRPGNSGYKKAMKRFNENIQ